MILSHYIIYCHFHCFSSSYHSNIYFSSCFFWEYIYDLARGINIFYRRNRKSLPQSLLYHSGCTVTLGAPQHAPRPALSPGTDQAPGVQPVPAFFAGGWNEVLGWCSCSGENFSNLPAGTCTCPRWYLAMAEMLWENCFQGHNKESKDRGTVGNHLFGVYLNSQNAWNTSLLQEKDILLIKNTCSYSWSLENSVLGVICC